MEIGAPGRIGDPVTVIHTNRTELVSAVPSLEDRAKDGQMALREKFERSTEIVLMTPVQVMAASNSICNKPCN